ncbi:MAG: ABC transporter ATP-binding protein [Planctomycetota bacterium]
MISVENLQFKYPRSDFALQVPSLKISAGDRIAIVGPSGSGKTTLLNLISGIATPDQGTITVGEINLPKLSEKQRRDFRISQIGFVFQKFELLDYLNVKDNILLPFLINDSLMLSSEVIERAESLTTQMGIKNKLNRRSDQLSQGEQQRVAICRALITQPNLILADEPTGNLDPNNKKLILDLLFHQATENKQTLIVVTHDMTLIDRFDTVVNFEEFLVKDQRSNGKESRTEDSTS